MIKDRKGNIVNVGDTIVMTVYRTEGGWAEPIQEECEVVKIDGNVFDAKVISTGYVNKNIPARHIKRLVK